MAKGKPISTKLGSRRAAATRSGFSDPGPRPASRSRAFRTALATRVRRATRVAAGRTIRTAARVARTAIRNVSTRSSFDTATGNAGRALSRAVGRNVSRAVGRVGSFLARGARRAAAFIATRSRAFLAALGIGPRSRGGLAGAGGFAGG